MIATRVRLTLAAAAAAVVLAACGSSGGYGSSSNSNTTAASAGATATTADNSGGGGYSYGPATTMAPTASTAASTGGSSSVALATVGSFGQALVDGKGMSLYLFEKDSAGKSACSGACANAWPPAMVSGAPVAGTGLDASKMSTLKRDDGTTQIVYNGHPLYTFAGDAAAGQAGGQGSGGTWFLVNAAGDKIAA
jgi:predicted lipoprotein with Yx(FWY)xxD motif